METVRQIALIGLLGAVGAICRHGLVVGVHRLAGYSFPAGTLAVNLLGCLLLGLLWGLGTAQPERPDWLSPSLRDALGIGLLGAFTTYSTFSLDTVKCLERQQYATAGVYVLSSLTLGLLAAYAGLALARWATAAG